MKENIPKGTGNSRYLKSAIPADITHEELVALLRGGTFPFDFNGINPEGFQQIGDPIGKATLLSDETASRLLLGPDAVPDDALQLIPPPGYIFWYTKETPPDGFLVCDGSTLLIEDYPVLYSVIGNAFGGNDTSFVLPDLRAAFVRGAGAQSGYSAAFGQKQEATYIVNGSNADYGNMDKNFGSYTGLVNAGTWSTVTRIGVRPFNIALTPIIKY